MFEVEVAYLSALSAARRTDMKFDMEQLGDVAYELRVKLQHSSYTSKWPESSNSLVTRGLSVGRAFALYLGQY